MKAMAAVVSMILLAAACGDEGGASDTVKLFAEYLADSSYQEAWGLITPESRAMFDSTASVLHKFGWLEAREAVVKFMGEMTREEFEELTGEDIFCRMVINAPETRELSTSVKSVSFPDSSVAVVVMKTREGLQEIIVRKYNGEWLVDLTNLSPPVRGEVR